MLLPIELATQCLVRRVDLYPADLPVGYRPASTTPRSALSSGQKLQIGGTEGDRTLDLLHAIQALSQLSYGPVVDRHGVLRTFVKRSWDTKPDLLTDSDDRLVDHTGFEPVTPILRFRCRRSPAET